LNADEPGMLGLTGGTTLGANLFTYCLNNPMINIDSTGYGTISITFKKNTICWIIAAISGYLTKKAITAMLTSASIAVATAIELGTAGFGTLLAGLVIFYGGWAASAAAVAITKSLAGRIYRGGNITIIIDKRWWLPNKEIKI